MLEQKAYCIWLTGLSGAGKSTLANVIKNNFLANNRQVYILDGDKLRLGLNRDLTFSDADRIENIRRVAEVAHLMVDAGLIVIVAFITPFYVQRMLARNLFEADNFVEIFLDSPLNVCEQRDVKGLYKKARNGKIKNFTGIDSAFERPENPDLLIDTSTNTVEYCAEEILTFLDAKFL